MNRIFQIVDSFFPSGSYAHSHGLESLVELGLIRDERDLIALLKNMLQTVFQQQELPACYFAHSLAGRCDRDGLFRLDAKVHALKLAQEARQASLQTGKARWNVLVSLIPDHPFLLECSRAMKKEEWQGHHCVVFGVQNACMGILPEDGASALAYHALSAMVSAGMRLLRFGQDSAQHIIYDIAKDIPGIVQLAHKISLEELGVSCPTLDIASMIHRRASRRLFLS